MRVIRPSFKILTELQGELFLSAIEHAARLCYKSEEKEGTETAAFVRRLLDKGHEAMIEHAPSISVQFVCDRGVSHELVRHRLFSFAQESTRYCNYANANEVVFILPWYYQNQAGAAYTIWAKTMRECEWAYLSLIELGAKPQEARAVLPNSLKTEIIITGNVREWRHFFRMRADKAAHPQMQELAYPLLQEFQKRIPLLFDDLGI